MAMVKDVFSTKWKQLVKIVAHSQLTWQRVRQSKVCWSSASMTATVSPSLSKSVMVWRSSLSTIYSNERIKGNGMWIESIKNVLTVNSLSFFCFICGQPGREKEKCGHVDLLFYLQLSKIEFKLAKLKTKLQMRGVLVPKLVQRPLRFVHLNQ